MNIDNYKLFSLTRAPHYFKLRPILVMLAKRNGSTSDNWYASNLSNDDRLCLICNKYIELSNFPLASIERTFALREHGAQHLIDKNLIPFL